MEGNCRYAFRFNYFLIGGEIHHARRATIESFAAILALKNFDQLVDDELDRAVILRECEFDVGGVLRLALPDVDQPISVGERHAAEAPAEVVGPFPPDELFEEGERHHVYHQGVAVVVHVDSGAVVGAGDQEAAFLFVDGGFQIGFGLFEIELNS